MSLCRLVVAWKRVAGWIAAWGARPLPRGLVMRTARCLGAMARHAPIASADLRMAPAGMDARNAGAAWCYCSSAPACCCCRINAPVTSSRPTAAASQPAWPAAQPTQPGLPAPSSCLSNSHYCSPNKLQRAIPTAAKPSHRAPSPLLACVAVLVHMHAAHIPHTQPTQPPQPLLMWVSTPCMPCLAPFHVHDVCCGSHAQSSACSAPPLTPSYTHHTPCCTGQAAPRSRQYSLRPSVLHCCFQMACGPRQLKQQSPSQCSQAEHRRRRQAAARPPCNLNALVNGPRRHVALAAGS